MYGSSGGCEEGSPRVLVYLKMVVVDSHSEAESAPIWRLINTGAQLMSLFGVGLLDIDNTRYTEYYARGQVVLKHTSDARHVQILRWKNV